MKKHRWIRQAAVNETKYVCLDCNRTVSGPADDAIKEAFKLDESESCTGGQTASAPRTLLG